MFVRHFAATCWILVAAACSSPRVDGSQSPSPVDELASWMDGSFRSSAQSARDPKRYLDVRLSMTRIFTDRDDGPWLYVEQAVATSLDRPYRQRVYRLAPRDGGGVVSEVYTLPGDPLDFAGAHREPTKLADLAPDRLTLRAGCAIELERIDAGTWRGGTRGRACASSLSNASYATSEVTITPTLVKSWDRGFDSNDAQVWGDTEGPYEFVKDGAADG